MPASRRSRRRRAARSARPHSAMKQRSDREAERRWQVRPARGTEGRSAVIYARIQALEATQGRAVREATLGDETAIKRLREIDAEINALRKELDSATSLSH